MKIITSLSKLTKTYIENSRLNNAYSSDPLYEVLVFVVVLIFCTIDSATASKFPSPLCLEQRIVGPLDIEQNRIPDDMIKLGILTLPIKTTNNYFSY